MRSAGRLLNADDVRGRLAAAVEPMFSAVLGNVDAQTRDFATGRLGVQVNGTSYAGRLAAVVQHSPLLLRIVLLGLPYAVELERLPGELVPGLAEITEDVLAGALASVNGRSADAAIVAAATQREGGFLFVFDREAGTIRVLVGKAGQDLGRAIELGGIGAQVTTH